MRMDACISQTLCMYMCMYILGEVCVCGGGGSVSLLQTTAFKRLCGILSCASFMRLDFHAHSAQVRFGAYPSIRLRYNVSSEIGSVRITTLGPVRIFTSPFVHLDFTVLILTVVRPVLKINHVTTVHTSGYICMCTNVTEWKHLLYCISTVPQRGM